MMKRMGRYRDPDPDPNPNRLSDEDDAEDDMDDDESFGPIPPPPAYPPPDAVPTGSVDQLSNHSYPYPDGEKFRDEYSDDEGGPTSYGGGSRDLESKGEDPPSDLPLHRMNGENEEEDSDDNDEGDDVDFRNGDDQYLEIPPTSVVQRMVIKENVAKTEQRKSLGIVAIVCCALILGIVLLVVGFSTDLFTKETTTAAAASTGDVDTGDTNATSDKDGDGDGGEDAPTDGGRSSRVRAYLMSKSLDKDAFQDPESPQNLASEYLGSDDTLQLDPANTTNAFQLMQKFALLAGFWFASDDDWSSGVGWAFTEDECSWEGVTCEVVSVNGTNVTAVTSIDLSDNNLQGFSEEIGLLTYLNYLDLNNNVISGSVPSAIVNLVNLERLYLYDNLLEGEWPGNLSSLSNLVELYASNNYFTDDVRKFFDMTALETLILDDNNLNGTLDGVGKLVNLERLTLGNNRIGGSVVAELGGLQYLGILWLYSNNLTGTIPAAIGALPDLTVFDVYSNSLGDGSSGPPLVFQNTPNLEILILSGNNWGGEIPDEYGSFAGPLISLYIENANLTGTINSNLANQQSLMYLRLGENNFTLADFPAFILGMTQLIDLRLNKCRIQGALPDGIGVLQNLEVLYLQDNFMDGSLSDTIGQLVSLKRLDLSNQFFGPVPAANEFEALPNLEYLNLGSNSFTGIMPLISHMQRLEYLDLRDNDFIGELTGGYLSNVPSLKYIDLSRTKINGVLPDNWDTMENLEELRLSSIGLSGQIPSTLGVVDTLEVLDLSDNAFGGLIPDMFKDLRQLRALELSRNRLVGPMPRSIGHLTSLEFFRVSENYNSVNNTFGITGPLPTEMGNLVNLVVFECAKNRINEKLPEEMGNIENLMVLDVSNNLLTGAVPSSLGRLKYLKTFYLSGNQFEMNGWSEDICAIDALKTVVADCDVGCADTCCADCVDGSG